MGRPIAGLAVRQQSDLLVVVRLLLAGRRAHRADPVDVERHQLVLGPPRLLVPAPQVILEALAEDLVAIEPDAVEVVLPDLPEPEAARVGDVEVRRLAREGIDVATLERDGVDADRTVVGDRFDSAAPDERVRGLRSCQRPPVSEPARSRRRMKRW